MGNKTSKTTNEITEDEEETALKVPLLSEEVKECRPANTEMGNLYSNLSLTQLEKMPTIWTMTENMTNIWKLFCEIHTLSEIRVSYVIVDNHQFFPREAFICWHTDVCDILLRTKKISREERGTKFILRRKTLLRLPNAK